MSAEIQVDEKLVKEIALLARLDLSQEETEMFVSQFNCLKKSGQWCEEHYRIVPVNRR